MRLKKNPSSDIDKSSSLYFAIGVATMMFITHIGINHKASNEVEKDLTVLHVDMDSEKEIPIVEFKTPPPPKPPPPAAPEVIEIVENEEEIVEAVIETTETDDAEEIKEPEVRVEEISVEEEEVDIEVPFTVIENVPIYPGCGNKKTNAERKLCMSQNITKHVGKRFNDGLAADLGLSGKQRIFVLFKISKTGDVIGVKARAPHPALAKEAEKVVRALPKMKPGEQRGRPVTVSYSLPIIFEVKDY